MKVKENIKRMKIEDKLRLLTGYDGFSAVRLDGVATGVKMADGPNGVKTKDGSATCFPNTCLMASSWDRESCYELGKMLGAECRTAGVDLLLGPAINIKRHPLCGRNFEYYSEDPVLTGALASRFVKGIREEGTATCVKHFACNNQENGRWALECTVDDDTLRNLYLKAFETVVTQAKPDMIMASYSSVNGVPATENAYLLKTVLREEWGFEGVVVSDWCAVENLSSAFQNGLDLEMPGNAKITVPALQKAMENGVLTEAEIDGKVERLLRLERFVKEKPQTATVTDAEVLRKRTAEAFVLLKNEGVLPLLRTEKLLVVGWRAESPRIQGGGCAELKTKLQSSPLAEMRKYNENCDYIPAYELSAEKLSALKKYDKVVVFVCVSDKNDSESFDREDICFPAEQTACVETLCRHHEKVVVVMQNGSAVETRFAENAKGLLETYYAGSYGGGAVADALFGKTSPAGRLAESFPLSLSQVSSNANFGAKKKIVYEEREFVGYRYYTTYGVKTAYPFGFGLTYCDFKTEEIEIKRTGAYEFEISCVVKNESAFDGKETLQVYLQSFSPFQPKLRLLDFCKVAVEKGGKKRAVIRLDKSHFERYENGKKILLTGEYAVCLAKSSEEILAEERVTLEEENLSIINEKTPLGFFLCNEKYRATALKYFEKAIKVWAFGDENATGDFEKEEFLKSSVYNMPMRSFVYFANGALDEEKLKKIVEELKTL